MHAFIGTFSQHYTNDTRDILLRCCARSNLEHSKAHGAAESA